MNKNNIVILFLVSAGVFLLSLLGLFSLPFAVPAALAHCDTIKGPVIEAAKKALESGNIDPVLIWVQKKDETEIRKAFEKARSVRKLNQEVRDMADMYFFETLVRVHRAGESEPYTGIKDSEVEPVIALADSAIEKGSVDELAGKMSSHLASKIKEKFTEVKEKKEGMNKSVEAGREYVKAYVEYTHFLEIVHGAIMGAEGHHKEGHKE